MTTDQGLIQSFLEIKIAETGASKNTIAAYERDLNDFKTWLQANRIKLLKVTQKQIESYMVSQEQKGFAPHNPSTSFIGNKTVFSTVL